MKLKLKDINGKVIKDGDTVFIRSLLPWGMEEATFKVIIDKKGIYVLGNVDFPGSWLSTYILEMNNPYPGMPEECKTIVRVVDATIEQRMDKKKEWQKLKDKIATCVGYHFAHEPKPISNIVEWERRFMQELSEVMKDEDG
jgi:hypothetical protein